MKKYLLIVAVIVLVLGIYFVSTQKSDVVLNQQIVSWYQPSIINTPAPTTPDTNNQQTEPKTSEKPVRSFNIQNMQIDVLQEGTGAVIKDGDKATVHYVGTLTNGQKFDSSVDRGTPFQFTVGANQVIKGWDLGVEGMKVGEARKLTIPPELGYGSAGTPGGPIPPNATLIFQVQLLKIN